MVRQMTQRLIILLALTLSSLPGWAITVTITTDTTIGLQNPGDGYINNDIIIDGATVTVSGTHDWESLTLLNGATLVHPVATADRLVLNITGDVTVDGTSIINLGALGDTSASGQPSNVGAPHAGFGGEPSTTPSLPAYGSVTQPIAYGLGGLAGRGGGAIQITAATMTVDGVISANGQTAASTSYGSSAGGSIWLTVGTLSGAGQIRANAGRATASTRGTGSGGRIAIYYTALNAFNVDTQVFANPGADGVTGAAGSIYLEEAGQPGRIRIRNTLATDTTSPTMISGTTVPIVAIGGTVGIPAATTVGDINTSAGGGVRAFTGAVAGNVSVLAGTVRVQSTFSGGDLTLDQNSALTPLSEASAVTDPHVNLTFQNVVVGAGSLFNANGYGAGVASGISSNIGLSHGGRGGLITGNFHPTYGSLTQPVTQGSGTFITTRRGGGAIQLSATSLQLDGTIRANGEASSSSSYGGASGGSIWLDVGDLSGAGLITADGGAGGASTRGGGGGGRIAIYYDTLSGFDLSGVTALGGSPTGTPGGAGTIYVEDGSGNGEIIARGNNDVGVTPLEGNLPYALTIENARVDLTSATSMTGDYTQNDGRLAVASTFTTTGNGALTNGARIQQLDNAAAIQLTFADLSVDATSTINVNSQGETGAAISSNFGGSHGGYGGVSSGGTPQATFGDLLSPTSFGTGVFYLGGGAVRVTADVLDLAGTIRANGQNSASSSYGGASGGSIWLDVQTLNGAGTISANGGNGGASTRGSGAGGRIAVYFDTAGTFDFANASALAGTVGISGGAGTLYIENSTTNDATVVVRNHVRDDSGTPLSGTISAALEIETALVETPGALTMSGNLDMSGGYLAIGSTAEFTGASLLASGSRILQLDIGSGNEIAATFGDLEIDATSTINVSSQGDTAAAISSNFGGSHGGFGGVSSGGTPQPTYGDFESPTTMGTSVFYRGGGAVQITAEDLILNGTIRSNGQNSSSTSYGGSSGGSIWLTVDSITGTGSISANGGAGGSSARGGGGGGRVALYYTNAPSFVLEDQITAYGNATGIGGGAGTVLLRQSAATVGELRVENEPGNPGVTDISGTLSHDVTVQRAELHIADTAVASGDLLVDDATLRVGLAFTAQDAQLINGASLRQLDLAELASVPIEVTLSNVTIDATSSINLNSQGRTAEGISSNFGASHAGYGGTSPGGTSNTPYGSLTQPTSFGTSVFYRGGGAARLIFADLQLDGTIQTNGQNSSSTSYGGSSGGSIWIDVATISGSGSMTANGGAGGSSTRGAGGGGRIALYYDALSGFDPLTQIDAFGGSVGYNGGAGTVYAFDRIAGQGTIAVRNGVADYERTPLQNVPNANLRVDQARAEMEANAMLGTIDVLNGGRLNIADNGLATTVTVDGATLGIGGVFAAQQIDLINSARMRQAVTASAAGDTKSDVQVNNFNIDATSSVNVSAEGLQNSPISSSTGGSYGGLGGGSSPLPVFGDETQPLDFGTGSFARGGGAIKITVASDLVLQGVIRADGQTGPSTSYGGGSGGAVWLDVNRISGTGSVSAVGGNGGNSSRGSGGGGRIALYYQDLTTFNPATQLSAPAGSIGLPGDAGTVYLQNFNLPPQVTDFTPLGQVATSTDRLIVTFSTRIDAATFDTSDVTVTNVTAGNTPVTVNSVQALSDFQFEIVLDAALPDAEYDVSIGPDIGNLSGTLMDQDDDTVPGEDPEDAYTANFTIDTSPPAALTISSHAALPTEHVVAALTVSLSGDRAEASSVEVNGQEIAAFGTGTWSGNVTLSEGVNDLAVTAVDGAGNASTPVDLRFIADTTAPQVTGLTPSGMTNAIPPNISINIVADTSGIDENASSVTVRRNGIALTGTLTYNPTSVVFAPAGGVLEGGYLVEGTLVDVAGNSTPLNSLGFTLDYTPPTAPTVDPLPGVVQVGQVTATGSKEVNASLWLNGQQVVASGTPAAFSIQVTLVEGDNNLSFVARDGAGNDSQPTVAMVRFDDSAPGPVAITIDPNGDGTTMGVNWVGYDEAANGGDIASYSVFTSSADFSDTSSASLSGTTGAGIQSTTLTGLTRGQVVYVAVVAVDAQGNQETAVTAVSATPVDVQAPADVAAIVVTNLADSADLSWTPPADSDVDAYLLTVDGGAPQDLGNVTSYTMTGLTAATSYAVALSVRDLDGNVSAGTNGSVVTYLPNPIIASTEPLNGRVNVTWAAANPSNLVQSYRLYAETTDFTDVSALTPRLTVPGSRLDAGVTGLTNGTTYFLAVQTVNTAGGADPVVSTTSATPEADGDGPDLTNHRYAGSVLFAASVLTDSALWQVDVSDESGISRVEFLIDGAVVQTDLSGTGTASFQLDLFTVTDGAHEFRIRAADTLNNEAEIAVNANVALAAPPAPAIASPSGNFATNETELTVTGTAAANSQVQGFVDAVPVGPLVPVDSNGGYSLTVTLQEGANNVTTQAEYPGRGGFGASSVTRVVTLDSTIPEKPQGLAATPKTMGEIRLEWNISNDANVVGYNLYRSTQSFADTSQAVQVNTSLLTANSYTDLLVTDDEYFYRVVSVNAVNTESEVSDEVSAFSDSTLPQALSIEYASTGNVDQTSGRMAPGLVNVTVTFSETLLTTPYLAIVPDGGVPSVVDLVGNVDDETVYTGSFVIEPTTPSGTAFAVLSAFDAVGNRGTDVLVGDTIEVDTDGPDLIELTVNPSSPIQNDPEGLGVGVTVEIVARLNDDTGSAIPPTIVPQIDGVPVSGLETGLTLQMDFQSQPGAPIYTSSFVLPLSAGQDDQGTPNAETLSFAYTADDDLGNTSTFINGSNAYQVYQGTLPPLEAPFGLTATPLPNGQVQLSWSAVAGSSGYQILRQAPADTSLQPITVVQGSQTLTFIDDGSFGSANVGNTGLEDGVYLFAVASERQENNQTSYSGASNSVTVTADGSAPDAPENFLAELTGNGVLMTWDAPSTEVQAGLLRYNIYRLDTPSGQPIDISGVTPYQDDIPDVIALDGTPSETDFTYAATAVDVAGNESVPSAPQYVNADLLPVSQLQVAVPENALPVLGWQHSGGAIAGFHVYAGESGIETLLTDPRLDASTFFYEDAGFTGGEIRYTVVAEDTNDVMSVPHEIRLPAISATLIDDGNEQRVRRNVFNQLMFRVDNAGPTPASGVRLYVTLIDNVGGVPTPRPHQSASFTVPGNGFATVPVVVGGYAGLDALSSMELRLEQVPTTGDLVTIHETGEVGVDDGAMVTTLATENFTRGATGTARFTIENNSAVQTEVVLARNAGAQASDQVRILVEDLDGNVLATTPVQQFTGNVVTLSNGTTVARIPAGESFTSGDLAVSVPSAAPDDVVIRLEVDQLHYRLGQPDHVSIQGVGASRETMVVETDYFGELTSVTPTFVPIGVSSRSVEIAGRAIHRATLTPLQDVSLRVIVRVAGFERQATVYADQNGDFTYTYQPNVDESGDYSVSVIHPDLQDRPVMGTFTLQSISVRPTTFNGALARNNAQELAVRVEPGRATPLTNLRLEYLEADQAGGQFVTGMTVTPSNPIDVAADGTAQVRFDVVGDATGPASGSLVLRLVADESVDPLSLITVNFTLQDAQPSLTNQPSFLEMGTPRDNTVVGSLTLKNQGLGPLVNMGLSLTQIDGVTPAPSWVNITNETTVAVLDIGEEHSVEIAAFPDTSVPEADYEFRLLVTSDNAPDRLIPVYIAVTQSGIGNILFHASDIYTATLDENNNIIPGLEGATIKLQNEQVLSNLFELDTDQFGNALFEDIPAGRYIFRASAEDHEDAAGRITVQPGITESAEVFLTNNLVTVEWSVTEITLEDRYEITLEATYKTDVPAAVVLMEPLAVNLPQLREGEVFYGELTLTNYGLIKAENVVADFPTGDDYLQYEFFATPPDELLPGDVFTIPYRVVALRDLDSGDEGDATGGASCESHSATARVTGNYECANGQVLPTSANANFSASGNASQCGGGGPGGGGGAGGGFFGTGSGGGGSGIGYVQRTSIEGSSSPGCGGAGGAGDSCSGGEGGSK